MAPHPSVGLPFSPPADIVPRRVMEPYAPCWCRSGKKWKWCHKDREKQPVVNFFEGQAKIRAAHQRGYCSHPDVPKGCSNRIVRAHTVQRRGGLAAIEEGGHVITALSAAQDLHRNQGEYVPREVGVNSASTFLGFCDHHDATMFRSVEAGETKLDAQAAFLLSFRSVAYELFQKRVHIQVLTMLRDTADKGKPFEAQSEIQTHLYYSLMGAHLGVQDLEALKGGLDTAYRDAAYSTTNFRGVLLDAVLPIAASGCFHPEYDFAGRAAQVLGRGALEYELVAMNVTAIGNKTAVILAWTGPTGSAASQFADSFAALPDDEKAEAAVRMAFEHSENVHMRPSWWKALGKNLQDAAARRMASGSPFHPERQAACLLPDGLTYVGRIPVAETISS